MSASREEGRVGVIAFAPLIRATQPRETFAALRTDMERGLRSLDAGNGKPLHIESIIKRGKQGR